MDSKKEKYFNNLPVEKWEIIGDYDKILLQSDKKMVINICVILGIFPNASIGVDGYEHVKR